MWNILEERRLADSPICGKRGLQDCQDWGPVSGLCQHGEEAAGRGERPHVGTTQRSVGWTLDTGAQTKTHPGSGKSAVCLSGIRWAGTKSRSAEATADGRQQAWRDPTLGCVLISHHSGGVEASWISCMLGAE